MFFKLRIVVLAILGMLFFIQPLEAVVKSRVSQDPGYYLNIAPELLQQQSVRALHKAAGKTFSLRERLTLRLLKQQLKKSKEEDLEKAYKEAKINTLSIVSALTGILPFFFLSNPLVAVILGPVALISSFVSMVQIINKNQKGIFFSIVGLIMGGLLLLYLLFLLILIIGGGWFG